MAKISVIVPIYNVEAYIEKCLDSIVSQTMADLEIILVNDGTKDRSMELCGPYIRRDSRIVVVNKENGGLMSAWIAGLKVATSPYVGFVDSDDWIDPGFFSDLYQNMEAQGADVVVGRYVSEYPEPVVLPRSESAVYAGREAVLGLMERYFLAFAAEENPISYCRWDKLYRRELLLRNLEHFNQKISLGEDVNTNAAVLPDCGKIVVLRDCAMYHYRINQTSIFHTYNENAVHGIVMLHDTLRRIAGVKGFSAACVDAFVGNMIFEEVNKIIRLPGTGFGEKRSLIQKVLKACPDGALAAYGEARGSRFIQIYCGLLQRGAVSACMLVRMAFDAVSRSR